jgi:hypothetical protein
VAKFKLALCRKYLTALTTTINGAADLQPASRPRPQARAARPVRPYGGPEHENTSMSSVKSTLSGPASVTTSIANKHALLPPSEILQLIGQPLDDSHSLAQSLRIKFELLLSYVLVQKTAVEAGDQESEWRNMLFDGRVQSTVNSAFSGAGGAMYREILGTIMETW